MSKIQLISMDLDGTLVNSQGGIDDENLQALHEAQDRGVLISVSSGRFAANVSVLMRKYDLRGPVSATNGCEILDKPFGQVLFRHLLDDKVARQAAQMLIDMDADFLTIGPTCTASSRPDGHHHTELGPQKQLYDEIGYHYEHGTDGVWRAIDEGICKFYVRDNGRLDQMREMFGKVDGLFVTASGTMNLELIPQNVDKGTGIRMIAEKFGIPLDNIMTMGDQENDLPMLTCVGYGVAMGNGTDFVKKSAKYTTGRCEDCGVAQAVRRFVL